MFTSVICNTRDNFCHVNVRYLQHVGHVDVRYLQQIWQYLSYWYKIDAAHMTIYIRLEPDRLEELSEDYCMYGNVNN
jgi:hypothetical protein